jgi:glycosyltransferase involved in cell wall biosynthesis
MKHAWILNHYAIEPGGAGGTRHYNLAKNLPAYGWTASIIAASVELNSGRQRLGPREKVRLEKFGGVPFLWLRTPEYHGNGGGRLLNMLIYSARVLWPSATKSLASPDVIIGSSVHPFAAFSGALLARRHKVPFIFEVRDLWPQTLIDLGRIKESSLTAWAMRRLEGWLYRKANRITVLLPRAADYIARYGISAEKVVWIPNGVELSEFPDPGPPISEPGKPFTMMYFGAHGQANGLDVLIKALSRACQRYSANRTRLRLIGDGPLKPTLQELAKTLGLNNDVISFESSVLKQDIPRIASEADAFVLVVRNAPNLYKYGISMNKLFDYMAGRRPVLIASAAANNPIADSMCGITVEPDNPDALAEGIIKLANLSYTERLAMGERGRRHVESQYSYESLAARLVKTLNEVLP